MKGGKNDNEADKQNLQKKDEKINSENRKKISKEDNIKEKMTNKFTKINKRHLIQWVETSKGALALLLDDEYLSAIQFEFEQTKENSNSKFLNPNSIMLLLFRIFIY
jgi:hypothetical protein